MNRTPNKQSAKALSTGRAKKPHPPGSDVKSAAAEQRRHTGRGELKAAREFNEAERKIVASGKVAAAARAAAATTEAKPQAMLAAEKEGNVERRNRIKWDFAAETLKEFSRHDKSWSGHDQECMGSLEGRHQGRRRHHLHRDGV